MKSNLSQCRMVTIIYLHSIICIGFEATMKFNLSQCRMVMIIYLHSIICIGFEATMKMGCLVPILYVKLACFLEAQGPSY